MPLKTLFLNPPSFENFDGGASSRWPATREIESYWYPVWLTYPAGIARGFAAARRAAPPRLRRGDHQNLARTMSSLCCSLPRSGGRATSAWPRPSRRRNPSIRIAFVGPPVTTDPDRALNECSALDFICRREFDYSVVEFANGKPLNEILGISYKKDGKVVHNPDRPQVEDLDRDAVGHEDLQARPGRDALQRALPAASLYRALLHARLPGAVHLLPVAANARAATPGASAPPTTWPPSWPGPRRTSPR